jgi:hypothetical protein
VSAPDTNRRDAHAAREAKHAEFVRTCLACGSVFNVLAGHGIEVCAAVLNHRYERRRAA